MADPLSRIKAALQAQLASGAAVVFTDTITALQDFDPALTQEETDRIARMRLPDQRRTHALGRGLIRYFGDLPTLAFTQSAHSKPTAPELFFNISHSGARVAIALHQSQPLGVDVERHTRNIRQDGMVDHVCHPSEKAWITAHPEEQRDTAFLRCWVRKEAVLKARGTGLTDDLPRIDTQPATARPIIDHDGPLRIWDFPEGLSDDPGALALPPVVGTVWLASLQSARLLTLSAEQGGV